MIRRTYSCSSTLAFLIFLLGLFRLCFKIYAWMNLARKDGGREWRRLVYGAARWFQPNPVRCGVMVPDRAKAQPRLPVRRSPKLALWQQVDNTEKQLQRLHLSSGFVRFEFCVGGPAAVITTITRDLETIFGEMWKDKTAEELLERLVGRPEWVGRLDLAADVGLLLMTLQGMLSFPTVEDVPEGSVALPGLTRRRLW